MIECLSISKTLSARSYTTVLPAVARRSPATRTTPINLNARIVVASVDCHVCCCVAVCVIGPNATGPSRPLRRSSEGKSSSAPDTFWSNPNCERSITDPCAADSAWIGWDRLCAFSLTDPLCPVAKRPANAGDRYRLLLVPTEPVPLSFECAQAWKNVRAKVRNASCAPPVESLHHHTEFVQH